MAKFCARIKNPTKAAVCRQSDVRVSFKNTHATVKRLKGMTVERAKAYLNNVLKRKECIPFFRFNSGVGRCSQAKQFKAVQGRWPKKSCRYALDMLANIENNAQFKGLDNEKLKINHVSVHRAQKNRRRTYRAHGRINPYMSTPCHIQIMAEEAKEDVSIPGIKKEKKVRRNTCFKAKKTKPHKRTYTAAKRAEAQAKLGEGAAKIAKSKVAPQKAKKSKKAAK